MSEVSTGTCQLCKQQTSKSEMRSHVAVCAPGHDAPGTPEAIVQLRIEAYYDANYWLYIEALASSPLKNLDSQLRHTWLECCGHMSAFRVGGSEPSMGKRLGSVFSKKGAKFSYEYDFGSTTTLVGQVVGSREGCLKRGSVRVMARNDPLDWRCASCSDPAVIVCPFCLYEGDCVFCEEHAEEHPCAEEEAYLPVVNSPRMGVCGYSG